MCRISVQRALAVSRFKSARCLACVAIAITIAGCGDKAGTPVSAKAPSKAASVNESEATSSTSKTAPSSTAAGDSKAKAASSAERDDTPRKPATVEEAQRVLDLTKFPLPKEAETEEQPSIALVRYRVPGDDVKSAFDFVRQQFTKRGWKEVEKANLTPEYASGTFGGQGFFAAVSAYPDSSKPDTKVISVSINNQGNLNLAKLPVPTGAKLHYSQPTNIGYLTEMPIDEATEAVGKLLGEQGWTPYGDNIAMKMYKQNAIELKVSISEMPTMKDKNMISFFPSLMSADLPAPPQPLSVNYTDYMSPPKQLIFESSASHEDLYKLYGETLAKAGWKPTTDNPIKDDRKWFMIFRNPGKDLLELETYDEQPENKIRGTLKHQSAAELAEIERQIEADRPRREAELKRKQQEEADKKAQTEREKKDKEAAEKARRRVIVEVPAGASDVKFESDGIEFKVVPGKAMAAADAIGKQLLEAGWKEQTSAKEKTAGTCVYERDSQSVTVTYFDAPVVGAEVSVSGFRVDFEKPASAEKK